MMRIFNHPFTLCVIGCSGAGKTYYNLIRYSSKVVANTYQNNGFGYVSVLYTSFQPLYKKMSEELGIPFDFFKETPQ